MLVCEWNLFIEIQDRLILECVNKSLRPSSKNSRKSKSYQNISDLKEPQKGNISTEKKNHGFGWRSGRCEKIFCFNFYIWTFVIISDSSLGKKLREGKKITKIYVKCIVEIYFCLKIAVKKCKKKRSWRSV